MNKLCNRCDKLRDIEDFLLINRRGKQVRKSECRECAKLRLRSWSQKRQEYVNNKVKTRLQQNKIKAIEFLGGLCAYCKQTYHIASYDFHHVDPKKKDSEISSLLARKWENIISELEKCVLLCSNCHRKIHAERIHINLTKKE